MMKVYSWNVCYFTKDVEALASAIHSLDFDVLCLQEVSEELLALLKDMPHELAYGIESVRFERRGEVPVYVAILSRHPIARQGTIGFTEPSMPLRTKMFIKGTFLGWTFVRDRGAIYADVSWGGRNVRVASVHLSTLWGSGNRRKEFLEVLEVGEEQAFIIAGDFNIIEYGPIKPLNWFLGGPLHEGMPWHPERHHIEAEFALRSLANPHRGMVTHPFSRSQLDHIVVSDGLAASDPRVHRDIGISDHWPISVSIAAR